MKINEFDKQVSQSDIDELEKFADKIFAKVGIDVNFTRHFLDRVNDERNGKPITMSELTRLFKQEQKRWGKKIAQLGPDEEAVMKDLQTDINLPFALRWDDKNNELDLIAKTVMRKKNFRTPNPEFPVEAAYPAQQISRYNPDGETYRYTNGGGRIPNSKSVSKRDITVKSKKVDFPDGATDDTTFNDFSKKELKQTALDVISTLDKREQLILKARFGFEPFNKSYTLQQVASAMDMSPERIRQIEAKALRRLKHPSSSRKLRSYLDENGLPPHLAKHFDKDGDAVKGSWKDGEWKADKKQPKKIKTTVKDVTPKGYGPLEEDFGSVPPLTELILMAVVAKTTVDVLIGMFKVALKTGKGLKKLNDLRKRVSKMGQGVADYALPEATKDELIAKMNDQYKKGHMAHAVHAMRALAQSKGDRHSLSYYAATIARAFSAIDRKELESAYREQFAEGIIHEDTLTELNILRKKNDGVKQSNPLVVLDKLSDRNDDKPFPIKFYDGETIEVTPKMARRFMNKYYDDLEPEQRDIVDRYITTKNGFIQAVKKLQIAEGWSDKYKKSIDCNNPKGFSQKAHCAGRKKKK